MGLDRVKLDASAGTVTFLTDGAIVSFGAVGKGYAVDRMGQVLRAREVSHALVSAGGSSVLAIGGRDKGWSVTVRSERPEKPLRLWLRDGALGTSGSGGQFVLLDGRRHGRVVDPRTGHEPRLVRARDRHHIRRHYRRCLVDGFRRRRAGARRDRTATHHSGTLAILTMNDAAGSTRVFGGYAGAHLAGW